MKLGNLSACVLTNILTSKYYIHSVLHSDFICTKPHSALPLQSNVWSTGEGKNVFILISKKGFKGESRRSIRLFSLPVSCGKPELSAVSLDKGQQQQRLRPLHVCMYSCIHLYFLCISEFLKAM